MPKIRFNGELHQFPDDWDNTKISDALQRHEATKREAVPPPTEFSPEEQTYLDVEIAHPDYADDKELASILASDSLYTPVKSDRTLRELTPKQEQFRSIIQRIETGGLDSTWVRTKVKNSGSTAYGTYQITRGLIGNYLKNHEDLFNDDEVAAMKELAKRQLVAIKIGGVDRPKYSKGGSHHAQAKIWAKDYGFESVDEFLDAFDYGGDLGLGKDEEFQLQYDNFARVMLNKHLSDAKGDALEAASVWHGGTSWAKAKSKKDTMAYRKKYSTYASKSGDVSGATPAPVSLRTKKEAPAQAPKAAALEPGVYQDEAGALFKVTKEGEIVEISNGTTTGQAN